MTRIKRGATANKRRKSLLKHTKGFHWGGKSKFRAAKERIHHAWEYSYRDRKVKKRDFRQFWQSRINVACRKQGINYSRLMAGLKKNKIAIDRKILADLAINNPKIFEKIVEKAKS